MAEERQNYQPPPTRPPTPLQLSRSPRIAEAPSRADPDLPLIEITSPPRASAVVTPEQRDSVNGHMTQHDEQRTQPAPQPSTPALLINGNSVDQSNPDMRLSSCTNRGYIPTPFNSPVQPNASQASNGSPMPTTRLRGGGPPKRPAPSSRGSAAKKTKLAMGKGRAPKKSKDDIYDDAETVLADGNSPLYDDANIPAILQHPLAQNALAGTTLGTQVQGLSLDALRRAATDFRNDGRLGYNDPDHLQQALAAVERRRNGDFDQYSDQRFDENWAANSSESEQEFAQPLTDFNHDGPAPNEDIANGPDEKDNEDEEQPLRGEYDPRLRNDHRYDDDDDNNNPDGPATSSANFDRHMLQSLRLERFDVGSR